MMHRIFDHDDEPLYGRKDCEIRLKPFRVSVMKEILHDYNPDYTPEDLLCLYMLTGGVAKYVAQLIAGGMTTQNQIDTIIGKNTGTYLKNLDEDYSYVSKLHPLFSKPGGRNVKWCIEDCFLRFWFRFVLPNQALVEMERNDLLLEIVLRDYNDYTGAVLEQYFRQKISEEDRVIRVGRYWDRKGLNEIDIIALNEIDKTALVAEVKRNAARYDSRLLEQKYQSIQSHFGGYKDVKLLGLSMADM